MRRCLDGCGTRWVREDHEELRAHEEGYLGDDQVVGPRQADVVPVADQEVPVLEGVHADPHPRLPVSGEVPRVVESRIESHVPATHGGKVVQGDLRHDAELGLVDPRNDLDSNATGEREKAVRAMRREERDQIIDRALGALRDVVSGRGLCLQSSFLAERILTKVLPGHGFTMRLGSLRMTPLDGVNAPILYDPREPGGIADGYHAWLEREDGELLDPSIFQTLAMRGVPVPEDGYLTWRERDFELDGLARMLYEELPGLELFGIEESEPHLARMMKIAMTGIPDRTPGTVHLDLRWRPGHGPSAGG